MTRSTTNTYFQRLSLLVGCAIGFSLTLGSPLTLLAQEPDHCKEWVGKVVSAEGLVEARRVSTDNWQPTTVGETFCPGDKLRVESWRAAIVLSNETIIRLDQGTTITFTEIENKETSWLELLEGIVHFISRVPQSLTITTPFVNATVEGTEFVIRVDSKETNVWVLEGTVRVENTLGKLLLEGGDAAVTRAEEGPQRRLDIHPRDAVQWALYYPPLLDVRTNAVTGLNQESLQAALGQYQSGDIRGALDQLNTIPLERRDPQFLGIRAGLLLSVGQIDKAKMDIKEALRQEQNNATALALQSVVSLVNNNKEEALQLANQSVESAPQSPVGYIARSYAQQSHFDIDAALNSAQQATTQSPDDALAWARVAELQLSLGYLGEAREAAQEAVRLNPNLARTQTILGFALLTEAKIADARKTFEQAIALDQADPLPRLGLGLTKIQKSELAEGRRDIEIAASLDPNNAIIRSYLGKAYFEEKWDSTPIDPNAELTWADLHNDTKQNQRAATQLQMAKDLDPQDPSPYFYDAIRKQSINQPVEALQDLQKSIELNDNRAVYRSKLFLDKDEAARSAAIGRVYRDLGFQQRALVEGWKSITTDPANHSAHRLLADSYSTQSLLEISRVSELLQAQLLQPYSINILQPQLAEASLQILEGSGPSNLSFNEYNPLFIRNRIAFQANGLVGNNDTFADDLVLSGINGPVSWSIGQFHYETAGFRTNADLEHNIYNAFVQTALTSSLNIQAEYRTRKTTLGDLQLNFEPDDFGPMDRGKEKLHTGRIGGHYSPMPNSDIIISTIFTKREENQDEFLASPPGALTRFHGVDKGFQYEGQYIFKHHRFNAIIGGGAYDVETDNTLSFDFPGFCPIPFPNCQLIDKFNTEHENAYLYTNVIFPLNATWLLGLSYDSFDGRDRDINKVLPKLGIRWDLVDWARFRAAYFKTIARPLAANQTIEPTQVAGFNQFFDDLPGTEVEHYGIGLDVILTKTLYGGVSYSRRDLEVPLIVGQNTTLFDQWADSFRLYGYWTPHNQWALSTTVEYEQFKRSSNEPTVSLGEALPKTKTLTIPVSARYFHSMGFFAAIGGTFVRQKVELAPSTTSTKDSDRFFLLDAALGYRLPKRLGIISLEGRNLLDKEFFFQDKNTETLGGLDITPTFTPDRTVFIRATFALN